MAEPDPSCLQCGERRSRVRAEALYCCTVSVGETPEVNQEWEHHRWADWTDRELDHFGVRPEAFEKHRRTDASTFDWIDCYDTKRGHTPADAEAVGGMWADAVGQCIGCGRKIEEATDA